MDAAESWLYGDDGFGANLAAVQQQLASLQGLVEAEPNGFGRAYLDAVAADQAAMEREFEAAAAVEAASKLADGGEVPVLRPMQGCSYVCL